MIARRYLQDSRAAAAAEMALIMPGIAFVLLNVVDVSSYIWKRMQLDMAAHEAVGAARVLCDTEAKLPATVGTNCPGYDTTMSSAAQATSSLGTDVSIAGTAEAYYCADEVDGERVLFKVAEVNEAVPDTCEDYETDSTSKPGLYISTTASYSYAPVFPGASVASLLTTPITRTAWLRLQ